MRIRVLYLLSFLLVGGAGVFIWTANRTRESQSHYLPVWSPAEACTYLDKREVWWQSWPRAKKEKGTVCVSCHTVVPYALARPILRHSQGQAAQTPEEARMLASVEERVSEWQQMAPAYPDARYGPGKSAQSRATEAVLNAVILASYDAGRDRLSPVTREAFDEAWALQEQSGNDAGGWQWQDFHLAPWETADAAYQGAAMFAIALENVPGNYGDLPSTSTHIAQMSAYLRRLYPAQTLMSQLYVLWASGQMPALLSEADRDSLLQRVRSLQRSDGGWSLFSLDAKDSWARLNHSQQSDGCATGLVVVAMEQSGVDRQDDSLRRGLEWLMHHQSTDGSWRAVSLNVRRNPNTDIGRFMSDAATGYAVMALTAAQQTEPSAEENHALNRVPTGSR